MIWIYERTRFSFAGRKRTDQSNEKIKDQTPTKNSQRNIWDSKEPESDSKEADGPLSNSQKRAESKSVKEQESRPEGAWAYRPKALSGSRKDSNKMSDSDIEVSNLSLPTEPDNQNQYQDKSSSRLEDKPAVDQSVEDEVRQTQRK